MDVQFELPSRRDVKKCVVTRETIEKGLAADPGHPGGRARGEPGRGASEILDEESASAAAASSPASGSSIGTLPASE